MNLMIPRIIWGAMLFVPVVYAFIASGVGPSEPPPESTLLYGMIGAAAISAALSFFLPRLLLRGALQQQTFVVHEAPDPTDEALFRDMPKTIRQFEDPADVRARVLPVWQAPFIVELALSESVAIYGVVLAFMGFDVPFWPPFLAAGALLVAIRFPTEERVLKSVEAAYDARMPRG